MSDRGKNPITRLDVPNLKEVVDESVDHVLRFWLNTQVAFDPMNQKHVDILKKSLADHISGELRTGLKHAAQRACEQALDHVWSLMRDPGYQRTRSERRKQNTERRRERDAERHRKDRIEREIDKQIKNGLVQ